jgi:hypothetical protein
MRNSLPLLSVSPQSQSVDNGRLDPATGSQVDRSARWVRYVLSAQDCLQCFDALIVAALLAIETGAYHSHIWPWRGFAAGPRHIAAGDAV